MNIDDIMQKIDTPEEPLVSIFEMQKSLIVKYDEIERNNGFQVSEPPYNSDDPKVQARIKDMFWRATEELSEALETLPPPSQLSRWTEFWDIETSIRHFFEELSDALHFLVEASILADIEPSAHPELNTLFNMLSTTKTTPTAAQLSGDWPQPPGLPLPWHAVPLTLHIAKIIFRMGSAANVFKNKPWKVTQMPTDIHKFEIRLLAVWSAFMDLWIVLGCDQKQVYVLYSKKYIVNKWRQETNY